MLGSQSERSCEKLSDMEDEAAMAAISPLLGRVTDLEIEPDVFLTENVLQRMTNKGVEFQKYRKRIMVKTNPQHLDIVRTVLKVTHPDVMENPKGRTAINSMMNEYVNEVDTTDHQVARSLEENLGALACEPDLIRGMCAFSEAEYNMWGSVYDQLLVRPSTLLSAWMIAHESNEPLER